MIGGHLTKSPAELSGNREPIFFFKADQLKLQFLGGGFKYFLFSPLPGEMIQFD